jgi:retron-type reverse transcriptase
VSQALCIGIVSKKVSYVLDADIRSFFDEINQQWLIRFLEHRIGDRHIIRLIQKRLRAGILEDEVVTISAIPKSKTRTSTAHSIGARNRGTCLPVTRLPPK